MKAIIIEDEFASRDYLQQVLQKHFVHMEIVAVADSVPEAVEAIRQYKPDIVYLDVEIKMGSGLDVLDQVRGIRFEVVFTTAFATFAVEAFRYHAVDYLLKPLNEALIVEATGRCMQRYRNGGQHQQIEALLSQFRQLAGAKAKLAIHTIDGIEFVEMEHIVYGEAKGNYTDLWLQNGNKVTTSRKLKDVEHTLPEHQFFRIHHSYIVNIRYVIRYYKGRGGYLLLHNDIALPVASAKKEEFISWLG